MNSRFATRARSAAAASLLAIIGLGCPSPHDEPPSAADSGSSTGVLTTTGILTSTDTGSTTEAGLETDGSADTHGSDDTNGGCNGSCVGGTSTDSCPTDIAAGSRFVLVFRAETANESPDCYDWCYWPRAVLRVYDPRIGQSTWLATSRLELEPVALAMADDDSLVLAAVDKPVAFEPGSSVILRASATGDPLWEVEPNTYVQQVEILGDEVIGLSSDGIVGLALADGSQRWTFESSELAGMAVEPDGGLYVVRREGGGDTVLRLDPGHDLLWEVPHPTAEGEERVDVKVARDELGGVVVGSQLRATDTEDEAIELRKLDADGIEAWVVRLDAGLAASSSRDDALLDMVPRPGGGVIVVGRSAQDDGIALALALDSQGNELWVETHDEQPGIGEAFEHVGLLDGQVLAVGCSPESWFSSYPL